MNNDYFFPYISRHLSPMPYFLTALLKVSRNWARD